MTSRLIWCLGVYGSASTWVFNAVRLAHEAAGVPVRTQFRQSGGGDELFAAPGTLLLKSHELKDPALAARVLEGAARIIVTVRDPRDSVTSLMRAHGQDFELALDHVAAALHLCARAAGQGNALLLAYETRFFEAPETLPLLAEALGLTLPEGAAARIFASLSRAEVERYIATLPARPGVLVSTDARDYLDPATHWHTHHAGRQGVVGGFAGFLTAAQEQAVRARVSDVYRFAA